MFRVSSKDATNAFQNGKASSIPYGGGLTNDKAIDAPSAQEQQIALIVLQLTSRTVQEANDAGSPVRLWPEGRIVEGGIDMVGLEVEILETKLRRSDDVGFDGEVARMDNFLSARLAFGGRWYSKSSKREEELEEDVEEIHGETFG